jgi:glycosyltransferase involved in cell wall biosynthesis
MKIAIDASQIVYETGVSNYTGNLLSALLSNDKKDDYLIFGGSLRRYKGLQLKLSQIYEDNMKNCRIKSFLYPPLLADIVWNRLGVLPIETLIGGIDVFHSSDWAQPESEAFKITTVHDLVPILYPKLSHPRLVAVHKRRLNRVKECVDRVIVPSYSTKNDLIKLGFEEKIIRVIPEAPDKIFRHSSNEEILRLKRKYRISGKYLLSVGVTPRKNTQRIIEAFEKVRAGINLKLVIAGYSHSKVEERRGVIYLGHIPASDMPVLYSGSQALVYPSLYEGFGLPILEAFSTRIPVVTSNQGSMKEVAGSSAVLVDPYDVNSIKDGILDALEKKNELVKEGRKTLLNYSWDKIAQETLKVYKESLI